MFKPNTATSVANYFTLIKDDKRRADIKKLHALIRKTVPSYKPVLVSGMIGYGMMPYESKSGRKGVWPRIALASQKNYISVYACAVNKDGKYIAELHKKELPKASIGRSCIRFKNTEAVDLDVLKKIFRETAKGTFGV
ncbi:DUF1801 domain-containing protein [Candidatus Uhrbacteria bacterium]|nr:DUF1801 domain-containing protein [Candidatus Uhrbacteria bacterium]